MVSHSGNSSSNLYRMVDVEGNIFQFGTQYDFRRVLVGIQDVDEREVFALREH